MGGSATWKEYYLRHPAAAPAFRGRVLVSERMEMHAPKKYALRAKDHQVSQSEGVGSCPCSAVWYSETLEPRTEPGGGAGKP